MSTKEKKKTKKVSTKKKREKKSAAQKIDFKNITIAERNKISDDLTSEINRCVWDFFKNRYDVTLQAEEKALEISVVSIAEFLGYVKSFDHLYTGSEDHQDFLVTLGESCGFCWAKAEFEDVKKEFADDENVTKSYGETIEYLEEKIAEYDEKLGYESSREVSEKEKEDMIALLKSGSDS